ncbi:alpha/beta-hydrolase [Hypomontagnella monticulosa]|nr:alpha/beta-hydrolase [Hypomontagnella monticulosa]
MLGSICLLALGSIASLVSAAQAKEDCPPAGANVTVHNGTPVGKTEVYDEITMYVTGEKTETAVLYLTDVFGIQLAENMLLADSFGRAGYLTVAPDMFNGTPAPADIDQPGFNTTQFLNQHTAEVTDPIIDTAITFMRTTLGVKKILVTGYCFGGRYTFRFLAEGKGADVGFAAHPSLLEDGEILARKGPVSIAQAENDSMTPPARRAEIDALLKNTSLPYSVALYGGTSHGFGVRANISNPVEKFGKEEAFFQAIRFFGAWA